MRAEFLTAQILGLKSVLPRARNMFECFLLKSVYARLSEFSNVLEEMHRGSQSESPRSAYLSSIGFACESLDRQGDLTSSSDPCAESNTESSLDSSDSDNDIHQSLPAAPDPRSEWFPYPSKKHFLGSLLLNLPSASISQKMTKFLWWWANELGAALPPLSQVRKIHQDMRIYSEPVRAHSYKGNLYYHRDVCEIVRNELSNPITACSLRSFGEDTGVHVQEQWQSHRWKTWFQGPMIRVREKDYFLYDLCKIRGDRIIWISKLYALCGDMRVEGVLCDIAENRIRLGDDRINISDIELMQPLCVDCDQNNICTLRGTWSP
jgi:hypothetical protein